MSKNQGLRGVDKLHVEVGGDVGVGGRVGIGSKVYLLVSISSLRVCHFSFFLCIQNLCCCYCSVAFSCADHRFCRGKRKHRVSQLLLAYL